MRVLLMPSAYLPDIGGVEVVTRELALQLRASGHEVQVWTGRSPDDDLPHHEVIDGLVVRRFVYPAPRAAVSSLLAWPAAALATLRHMSRALRDFRPDVINVHCFSSNGAYATALSLWARVPLIVSLHGETIMDDNKIYEHSLFLRLALRAGFGRARWVTGCSQFVLDDALLRFGLRPSKARVIFNGINLAGLQPECVSIPFSRYVVAVGRLVHNKGLDLLIDAFAELRQSREDDVGLVIVGGGPELAALQSRAAQARVADAVHFTGWLQPGEVAQVVRQALVLVVPSRVEPFGMVVLEAWREGTAVIATRHGGTREFIESETSGLVVDPIQGDALLLALRTLVEDESLRIRLEQGGRRAVDQLTSSRAAREYVKCYPDNQETPN